MPWVSHQELATVCNKVSGPCNQAGCIIVMIIVPCFDAWPREACKLDSRPDRKPKEFGQVTLGLQ